MGGPWVLAQGQQALAASVGIVRKSLHGPVTNIQTADVLFVAYDRGSDLEGDTKRGKEGRQQ